MSCGSVLQCLWGLIHLLHMPGIIHDISIAAKLYEFMHPRVYDFFWYTNEDILRNVWLCLFGYKHSLKYYQV